MNYMMNRQFIKNINYLEQNVPPVIRLIIQSLNATLFHTSQKKKRLSNNIFMKISN